MAIIFSDALKVRETLSSNWEDITLQVEGQPGKGIPPSGLLKQVIVKRSAADYDVIWASIVDLVYPIGSIYTSVNNISPATIFGGTWEQIQDTFLLAAGQNYSAGSSGGEAEHILTIDEMPSHQHTISNPNSSSSINEVVYPQTSGNNARNSASWNWQPTGFTGGGQAHNNMPPYLAVYMWKRTA